GFTGGGDGGPRLALLAGQLGGPGNADGIGGQARFAGPRGVASDGAGNLFVADTDNHVVRKVVIATGAVTTFAGTAGSSGSADAVGVAAAFNHPSGIASDGAGNLYVADTDNSTIRRVVIASAQVSTLAGAVSTPGSTDGTGGVARFNHPAGLTFDSGALYVTDRM